ncbi:MAG: hypothetical protein ACJ8EY_01050 [Sphingomicrobium sp.]
MDESLWWLMDIVGPAVLVVLLLWLVLKTRSGKRRDDVAERGTHDLYVEEEQRRRDGTDDL